MTMQLSSTRTWPITPHGVWVEVCRRWQLHRSPVSIDPPTLAVLAIVCGDSACPDTASADIQIIASTNVRSFINKVRTIHARTGKKHSAATTDMRRRVPLASKNQTTVTVPPPSWASVRTAGRQFQSTRPSC
jgi:hypothetical protein